MIFSGNRYPSRIGVRDRPFRDHALPASPFLSLLAQPCELPERGGEVFVVLFEFRVAGLAGEGRKFAGFGAVVVGGTQRWARASVPRANA